MKRLIHPLWLATLCVASGIIMLLYIGPLALGQEKPKALPGGPGLAAQYPGDEGLERDARVLFVEDIEIRE